MKGTYKDSISKYTALLLIFFKDNNYFYIQSCFYPPLSSSQYNTILNRKIEREKQQQKTDFKETAAAGNRHFPGMEQQTPSYILPP